MFLIFVFFGKKICNVDFTVNMRDGYSFVLNIFSNCIFFNLYVSEAFRCIILRPVYTCLVIIIELGRFSRVLKVEVIT